MRRIVSCKQFRRVEQFIDLEGSFDPGALKGGIIDVVCTGHGSRKHPPTNNRTYQ
jgi:hypothetical protein